MLKSISFFAVMAIASAHKKQMCSGGRGFNPEECDSGWCEKRNRCAQPAHEGRSCLSREDAVTSPRRGFWCDEGLACRDDWEDNAVAFDGDFNREYNYDRYDRFVCGPCIPNNDDLDEDVFCGYNEDCCDDWTCENPD